MIGVSGDFKALVKTAFNAVFHAGVTCAKKAEGMAGAVRELIWRLHEQLWLAARIHHTALPTAKRYSGKADSNT